MTVSELYARLNRNLPERGRRKHRNGTPLKIIAIRTSGEQSLRAIPRAVEVVSA